MFNKKNKNDKKNKSRKKFVLNNATPFIITEAYKTARANIIFALATSKKKVITFTSATPKEGKSTTCVNMAITLANTGSKVLILDADLRKPAVHKMLKLENKHGLSTLLSEKLSISDVCRVNIRDNLDVITAGNIPPNPSELLSSEKMTEIMNILEQQYDYICIDTPPINIMSDALVLNPVSSGIVFVVQENVTTHGDIQIALENIKLTNGKVLGFVKNGCLGEAGVSRGYSYKYSYEYKDKLVQTV